MAGLYAAYIRVGKYEMHGLSIGKRRKARSSSATMRFNLEDGKIGEFRHSARASTRVRRRGRYRIGRFALKSLDLANLLRVSAQFSNPAQKPGPDQLLGLLALLGGVEVKGAIRN